MPIIQVNQLFANHIKAGRLKQMIVPVHKRCPIKTGINLYLYNGQREKKHLRTAVCRAIKNVAIISYEYKMIMLEGRILLLDEIKKLANTLYFTNIDEMFTYYQKRYSLPFEGQLIGW